MKILLICAVSLLWLYALLLIVYAILDAYFVQHPDKYKASVLWHLERRERRQQRYQHARKMMVEAEKHISFVEKAEKLIKEA